MSSTNSGWSFEDDDNNHYSVNNKVMIVAFVCLFLVILIVVSLHIYARCLIRSHHARRQAALRRLTVGGGVASQTHILEPPHKTGLDPSVIAALPTFVYKKSGRDDDPSSECAICLTALEEEETARLLPNCKHAFHVECIDMWLHSNSTCPICRSGAEPRPPEEKGEPALASAPPSEFLDGAADSVGQSSKVGGSGSSFRLSSFRRMLSRERSDRRLQADVVEDLERQ